LTKLERIIVTLPPIAFIIRKSKQVIIPGFQGLPLFDVVVFFMQQVQKLGFDERAAAIAFNLIMALPATMLFLFSLIPYFPEFLDIKVQILSLFKDISPSSNTYRFIVNLIDDLMTRNVGVFSFGFLLVFFYASNAMMAFIRTFDKSIKEKKEYFLHQRWRAIKLTGILILLIIASLLVLFGQDQIATLIRKLFHLKRSTMMPWLNAVRWAIIFSLFFYGIAFIYKFAPSVEKRWKIASPGTLLATFLTLCTTIAFSYWVNNFASYNKVYGSIGTVLIIMLLIYINALILLIGFELNVSITYLTRHANERKAKEKALPVHFPGQL
jgi:membrane protein